MTMLKQQSQPPDQSAAQMRVKKEEFARAITALEARRQSAAQELEGTVVIGDVLQQLQINVPADEVLQEIEAIHAGQPHEKKIRRPLWDAEQAANAKLVAGIILVPLATIWIASLVFSPLRPPKSIVTGGSMQNRPLWMPPPPNLPKGATTEAMDEGGFNASSVLKPLSAVPDNQPVHCNSASLLQLIASVSSPRNYTSQRPLPDPAVLAQSRQLFDVRPNLRKPWVLIKHDQRLYLRGWVAVKFTEAQAQGHAVMLHSSPQTFDFGVQPCPVTLAMSFILDSGYEEQTYYEEIAPSFKLSNVHLDNHAYEKWKP